MTEWVLLVWLVITPEGQPATLAPAFEVGAFRMEARCIASRDSITVQSPDNGSFIAMCVERDK